ncbi:MAG TPA: SIS domain-containing protein [Thermoanaerobaculia bacterium]|nr:SIS domain-containing protein [Thermoanaerobaculia bacterium]
MSLDSYRDQITTVLDRLWTTQSDTIRSAARLMAGSAAAGGLVHLFGSGHSVLPVQDVFPRYGSYPVFRPLMDARLMWQNVLGSGGAKALLWLERREGYARVLFENEPIRKGDVMVVFSHGGLNAVGIEVAMEARERGLQVVAVTSMDNQRKSKATHSSGKKLSDVADLVIDNCVPAEDALVAVKGWKAPVAAGSTVAFVAIAMSLVAEVAKELAARGISQPVFVSPNVPGIPADNNQQVFAAYEQAVKR